MKYLTSILVIVALSAAGSAVGQTFFRDGMHPRVLPTGGGYGNTGSATIEEASERGTADLARSIGTYHQRTAEAAAGWGEANRVFMDDYIHGVQTYFDGRALNRRLAAAERPPVRDPAYYVRLAQADAPARLSPSQLDSVSGRINWPLLLRAGSTEETRAALQRIFANRAEYGGLTAEQYLQALRLTQALSANLKSRIAELPPQQFIVAKKFVDSLAYEASLSPT